MQSIKDLQFQSELNRASLNYIETLLKIADKYEANRDEIIKHEVETLRKSILGGSFAEYETGSIAEPSAGSVKHTETEKEDK